MYVRTPYGMCVREDPWGSWEHGLTCLGVPTQNTGRQAHGEGGGGWYVRYVEKCVCASVSMYWLYFVTTVQCLPLPNYGVILSLILSAPKGTFTVP